MIRAKGENRAKVRSVADDQRGLALIEFAMVLPVLLLLFLAGYQLMDALSCKRKVGVTDRTIADLATQSKILAAADVDTILAASTQVMAPYDVAAASIRVSQLATDSSGNTTVSWSRARNATARIKGSSYTLPGTIKSNGAYLIVSEITYAYNPRISFGIVGPMALSDILYMSPRVSPSVTCNDCS